MGRFINLSIDQFQKFQSTNAHCRRRRETIEFWVSFRGHQASARQFSSLLISFSTSRWQNRVVLSVSPCTPARYRNFNRMSERKRNKKRRGRRERARMTYAKFLHPLALSPPSPHKNCTWIYHGNSRLTAQRWGQDFNECPDPWHGILQVAWRLQIPPRFSQRFFPDHFGTSRLSDILKSSIIYVNQVEQFKSTHKSKVPIAIVHFVREGSGKLSRRARRTLGDNSIFYFERTDRYCFKVQWFSNRTFKLYL